MSNATVRGHFVWHELMTTDTQSAAAFFAKAVGWKTQPWPHDPSYTIFIAKDHPIGGLMVIPEEAKKMGAPPSWVTYVGTPNVDETAQQAVALGAKILKAPADIPTSGRFAIIQDPQGAVFALYSALHPMPETAPGIGDISWHELATTDWRAALTFYQRLFGWDATSAMDMGPEAGTYQMYGWNGKAQGGIYNKSKQMPGPPAWLPYISVADSRKTAETIKKSGGQVVNGPMQVPGGNWIAMAMDPQGAAFAVHSVTAPAKSAPAKPKTAKRPAARKTARKAKPARRKAAAKRPKAEARSKKKKSGSKKRRR